MTVLIIDNYDSFAYNLAQYVGELGYYPVAHRHDAVTLEEIEDMAPSHIIISPGPRTPLEAGISNDVIRCFGGKIPILGVCLGHQCIGYVYGGHIAAAPVPTHGKSSEVFHDGRTVYRGLAAPFGAGRYHSLVVSRDGLPGVLEISAWSRDGVIMGLRHKTYVVEGVQFHPESILTEAVHHIISNFLDLNQAVWLEAQNG